MSKPEKSYQFNEDSIKCPICSKFFTHPRVLPCLHSFCENCLKNHITGESQGQKDKKAGQPDDPNKPPNKDDRTTGSVSPKKATGSVSPTKANGATLKVNKQTYTTCSQHTVYLLD